MYELVQVSEKCYYINCPAKIGVYVADSENVYLVDSGNDKDAGRKVRQILDKNGWYVAAILNTHSNADHIGGNRYLQGQTGCKVYSGGIEAAFTKYPVLEPSFLYGGYPCKDLRHKFLMAQESDVVDFSDEGFPQEIEVSERILSICEEPMCFERILQEVFKGYGLSMNFEQYVLVGSTVRSYLSWLKDTGRLSAEFQDSMLLWQKA